MAEDLDDLRRQVASGKCGGAEAHLRLAKALVVADQREEALTVLKTAILTRASEDASELQVVRQESQLHDLLARLVPAPELAATLDTARAHPVFTEPFSPREYDAGRRVRASDFNEKDAEVWASDHRVPPPHIEPTAAKTREELLEDLRGATDLHLRVDAATALQAFGDAEVLHALVDACDDPALAKTAYPSIVKLLNLPVVVFTMPICLIDSLLTEDARRPALARRLAGQWLRKLIARRCAGDAAIEYTLPVALPDGSMLYRIWKGESTASAAVRALPKAEQLWVMLLMLVRAKTDEEATGVTANFPELSI